MIYWKNQSTLDWLIQYNTIQYSVFWISLSRIPLFLHKKSNHIFTVRKAAHSFTCIKTIWKQKLSYVCRVVVRSLLPRDVYAVIKIPHYTTLQKFAVTVSGTILEKIKITSSFVVLLLSNIRRLFIGIMDSSGFKLSIQCFTILYRQSKLT